MVKMEIRKTTHLGQLGIAEEFGGLPTLLFELAGNARLVKAGFATVPGGHPVVEKLRRPALAITIGRQDFEFRTQHFGFDAAVETQ